MLKIIKFHKNAELPTRAHENDAGLDCKAVTVELLDRDGNVTTDRDKAVQVKYGLGIGIEIPKYHAILIFCRSSVYKTGMSLSNAVGVVDCGYQGEISVIFNINKDSRIYEVGNKVCQLVLVPIETPSCYWGDFDYKTLRADGGYGHTGI